MAVYFFLKVQMTKTSLHCTHVSDADIVYIDLYPFISIKIAIMQSEAEMNYHNCPKAD